MKLEEERKTGACGSVTADVVPKSAPTSAPTAPPDRPIVNRYCGTCFWHESFKGVTRCRLCLADGPDALPLWGPDCEHYHGEAPSAWCLAHGGKEVRYCRDLIGTLPQCPSFTRLAPACRTCMARATCSITIAPPDMHCWLGPAPAPKEE